MTDPADFSPNPFDAAPEISLEVPVAIVGEATPPARTKGRWIALAVVVALVAAGIGVFAATRTTEAARFSLAAAETSATSAQNVAFEMNITIGSTTAAATARLDAAHQLMAMDMDMASLGHVKVSAVFDMAKGVMYMDTASLGSLGLNAPTKWVSIDLGKFPGMKKAFGAQASTNPLDFARVLAKAKSSKDLGTETFRGEQVKHYLVTVDPAAALEANPELKQQLGASMPKELVYDVYVTAGNQLRRIEFGLPIGGQTMSYDMVLTAVGTVEPIVIPDAADVTDMSTLITQS
jgi:hypothetical protein